MDYEIKQCRICKAETKRFLDIGRTHPPEEFRTESELQKPIVTFQLGLSYCTKCGQVQLTSEIPPDIMYKENYFYDYSVTQTGLKHWTALANTLYKTYNLKDNDLVVDIGSNTGTLLEIFKGMGIEILGIDPADKQVKIANDRGIETINAYFGPKVAQEALGKYGKAKMITCNNVFDHVHDLYEFMDGIKILLSDDGVFVAEVPYFYSFVKTLGHVVYHQQLDYLLVKPFMQLFENVGMELIDCEDIPFHGGSIRIHVAFKGKHAVSPHVAEFVKREDELIFNDEPKALAEFARQILEQKDELRKTLLDLKSKGKSIAAVGASAKGNVLLFYCGIGPDIIDFMTEKSSLKVGRYTPSGIPVVEDSELIRRKPDYAVLLAWNFRDEVFKNLNEYTKNGGRFIIPIPKVEIV